MLKKLPQIIFFLVSLIASVGLFWWLYQDADWSVMTRILKESNMFWVITPLVLYAISDLIKGWKWKLLLEANNPQVSILTASVSIFISNVANFVIPRVGDVVKIAVLKKLSNVPVSSSLGTIITQGIVDLIFLVFFVLLVTLLEFDRIGHLVVEKVSFLWAGISSNALRSIVALLVVVLVISGLIFLLRKSSVSDKIRFFIKDTTKEIMSIFRLGQKKALLYFGLTFAIWGLYFSMYYSLYSISPSLSGFTLTAVLSTMVLGTMGFVMPSPGALGTFHLAVTIAMVAYGVDESMGRMLAAFMHGNITLETILMGSMALFVFLILIQRARNKSSVPS